MGLPLTPAPIGAVAVDEEVRVDGERILDAALLHPRAAAGRPEVTRVKMLYSAAGLYVLMDGEDRTLTATMNEDFLDLWTQDVFEFFLWPDERYPVYFELDG